ncbi:MAG: PQQ-binding-like beta-propeller repeat protein [Salinirussus sp.]
MAGGTRAVDLGTVDPARTRHAGRRSAVALTDELVVAGTADGTVRAFERPGARERWRAGSADDGAAVVSLEPFDGGVAVGERGPDGGVRVHDAGTGRRRFRYATAADVGGPQRESRFFRPFVVDLAADSGRLYAAARRSERDGDERSFTSVVSAVEPDGSVAWRFRADASPTALDCRDGDLAVAYNRCPGDHDRGLVVLDAATGTERWSWDPGGDERRVGDVSLLADGAVVASHADYRGYALDAGGTVRWRVDLATPRAVGDETLYAYPNHVHATGAGTVFVTGNTYPAEGRETASLHPDEHTAFGCAPDGDPVWTAPVGGFANELGTDGERVAVPGAQHFRTRDSGVHGLALFGTAGGPRASRETDGIVTAVGLDARSFAAVEEPVVYHDEGTERGEYRLLLGSVPVD